MGFSGLSCSKSMERWPLSPSWERVVLESLKSPAASSLFLETADRNESEWDAVIPQAAAA